MNVLIWLAYSMNYFEQEAYIKQHTDAESSELNKVHIVQLTVPRAQ